MRRDFTYVDDIVEGVVRVLAAAAGAGDAARRAAIYNIGNSEAVDADRRSSPRWRACSAARRSATTQPMQPGDMPATYASIDRLRAADRIRAAHAARRRARALRRVVSRLSTAS